MNTLTRVVDLLEDAGMRIDPDKSELIHFSRNKKTPVDPILTSIYGNMLTIHPKPVLRWLGIFFDSKLTYKDHVKIMANRVTSVANGIKVLANTVRGLSQKHIRILFKTCVVPILTYASPVWFRLDRSQIGLVGSLEVVQNISLRQIAGAFRTTPIDALRVLSHQPPMFNTLQKLSSSAADRLLKIPFNSLVAQRLPDT